MKVTVFLEVDNRNMVEQVMVPDTRRDWRQVMSEMACRIELATFGPPMDEELAMSDGPYHFVPGKPNT